MKVNEGEDINTSSVTDFTFSRIVLFLSRRYCVSLANKLSVLRGVESANSIQFFNLPKRHSKYFSLQK